MPQSLRRIREARRLLRGLGARARGPAREVELRQYELLVEQAIPGAQAAMAVIAMTFLVSPLLPNTGWLLAIGTLRCISLAHDLHYARRLKAELEQGQPRQSTRHHVAAGMGISAFLWGALTWPLVIGTSLGFMAFLIVTISLFSVSLMIIGAGYHPRALLWATLGGMLGLAPKIAALTPQIGFFLPIGFAIYGVTVFAYARVVARQTRAGVLLHMRNRANAARLAQANGALEEALARANWLADRDALTELRNRRSFQHELDDFLTRFAHRKVGLLLLDLDHFKGINDRFGHDTGDGVLLAVGTCLKQWEAEATGRMTGRWGGEEFIALIAIRRDETLDSVAEDLRDRFEMLGFSLPWPDDMVLTTSIGCAPLKGVAHFDEALSRADAALYHAKQAGRNCWKLAA